MIGVKQSPSRREDSQSRLLVERPDGGFGYASTGQCVRGISQIYSWRRLPASDTVSFADRREEEVARMSNGIRVILDIIGGALLLLAGIRGKPMRATRRAAMQIRVSRLNQRALVLFGSSDIYGPTTETLFARYPGARRVVLEDTGQLPWL